jgi:hypothetical protein
MHQSSKWIYLDIKKLWVPLQFKMAAYFQDGSYLMTENKIFLLFDLVKLADSSTY